MTISKTENGKWRVRVDVGTDSNGRRVRKTGTFVSKREAQKNEHLWNELARVGLTTCERITLEDFTMQVYLPDTKKRVRWKTYQRYELDIRLRVLPTLGTYKLDEIDHQAIQNMIDSCATYKVAKTSHATLRQILGCAIDHGILKENIAKQSYRFPVQSIHPDQHYGDWLTTFEQHEQFISQVKNPLFQLVCRLGLGLGLRKGEIFGLNWEDFDLEKHVVHIQRTYVKEEKGYELLPPKTYTSDRWVPMHERLYQYIVEIWENRGKPTCGPVVINKFGERANPYNAGKDWKKYLDKNNLKQVSLLNLRHSFATACLNSGIEITKVSKLMGHSDISTTVNRYVRFKPQDFVTEFNNAITFGN